MFLLYRRFVCVNLFSPVFNAGPICVRAKIDDFERFSGKMTPTSVKCIFHYRPEFILLRKCRIIPVPECSLATDSRPQKHLRHQVPGEALIFGCSTDPAMVCFWLAWWVLTNHNRIGMMEPAPTVNNVIALFSNTAERCALYSGDQGCPGHWSERSWHFLRLWMKFDRNFKISSTRCSQTRF